jgi:hypothetical protein
VHLSKWLFVGCVGWIVWCWGWVGKAGYAVFNRRAGPGQASLDRQENREKHWQQQMDSTISMEQDLETMASDKHLQTKK